ncbi:SDR family oxidoreductase [Aquimarina megaterium]|uniref:SDR family oxidoreductase n=1 Tax=Aquimarina megaterium TaxID=1443666 RepID=UPI00046E918F|nr:SDR family oxidoreductase [Aquimarina megaterium]
MSKIKNSRVLVTGGAGFIGSNLLERLLKQDNEVVCLDNFSTGKRENIIEFDKHKSFKLIEGDIRDYKTCKKAVTGCDYVLHQAALGSVPRSINDPLTSNEVNVSGFLNMLKSSEEAKVKKFVYAASSSTYGDHPGLPKVEDKIGSPLSPYAVTKYVNELYAKVFSDIYEINTIGLRYFNVFGRKQDPNGAYAAVIPKFISLLMQKESPIINGDGSHSRDFTYIDNVIQINQLAALADDKANNTVYNVAYGENTSLNGMVDILKDLLSQYDKSINLVKIVNGPERKGDVKHSLADISKAKELLHYSPQYSFKEGIREAVDWYWNNYGN